jgi:hypothetical protein
VSGLNQPSLAQDATGPLPNPGGQPGQERRDIVCKSLKIVGPDGKERVTLGYSEVSGHVNIRRADGKILAVLGVGKLSQCGVLNLRDENGKNRVILEGTTAGGACSFSDKDDRLHAFVGSATDREGGIVTVLGPQNKRVVQLTGDNEGGVVRVNNHEEKARASLWVSAGGKTGLLNLNGLDGKPLAALGVDDHGGILDLHGTNGKRQVVLDCHNQTGGRLYLYTPQQGNLIYLGGASDNGHGLFKLYATDGLSRVEMAVDNTGTGTVQGYSATNLVRWLK